MKTLAILATAFLGLTSMAAAQTTENRMTPIPVQQNNGLIRFPLITSTMSADIYIVRIAGSEKNEVLGTATVQAGVTTDLKIRRQQRPRASAVMAVMWGNDEVLDLEKIDLNT